MKYNKEQVFRGTLGVFICIQPILELMWLNNGTIGEILGFSVPTIVRLLFMGAIACEWLYCRGNIRKVLVVGLYGMLVCVYFVFHNIHCIDFTTLQGDNLGYSTVGELFYIVRMMIPICVLLFTVECQVSRKFFNACIVIVSMQISLLVIITNLFKISFGSYTNEVIKINFLDWFFSKKDIGYLMMASKGWFYSSIVSTILVTTLAYLIFLFFRNNQIKYILFICTQSMALYMFGTKAASISVLICVFLMLICYAILNVIKVEHNWNWMLFSKIAVVLMISIFIYNFSPCNRRIGFEENYLEERNEEEEKRKEEKKDESGLDDISENDTKAIVNYFNKYKDYLSINLAMLDGAYGYKYDPVFWKDFVEDTVPAQRMQNRYLEEEILKRIQKVNNNSLDNYLGMGFTRTSSIFNLERDFLYQYYSMGMIGVVLLLGPYILVLIWAMLKMAFPIRNCTLEKCALVLGLGLTFFVAYYSGNVMESLGITIVIGFVEGYLVNTIMRKETDTI